MKKSLSISNSQKQSEVELECALNHAQTIIDKSYLEQLGSLDVVTPGSEIADIDVTECGKFFRLERLVINKEENFLDKLVTIANTVAPLDCSLTTIVESDGIKINYYIGVVAKHARQDNEKDRTLRQASADAFSGAIEGNFSGSTVHELDKNETDIFCDGLFSGKQEHTIAAVSGIVSLRNKDERNAKSYVQGLENLTNSMKGKAYTIIMIADSVDSGQIRMAKQGYEMMYTQLSYLHKYSMTMNESESSNWSDAQNEGVTKGISEGVTRSQFNSTNRSYTTGLSSGENYGLTATPFGIGGTWGSSYNKTESNTSGLTNGESIAGSLTHNRSENIGRTSTIGGGTEQGKSLQINTENRSVKGLVDKIDLYLERLDTAGNFGAFQCATYVLTKNREDALSVAGHYNALMRGDDSFVQSSHINVWSPKRSLSQSNSNSTTGLIMQYLQAFSHPEFYLEKQQNEVIVSPASLISGKELAIQFAMPKKSVHGLAVLEMVPFGRNMPMVDKGRNLELGNLYYMGREESTGSRVPLNMESLTAHTFVTGSTGSGKSNTIYHMVNELDNKGVKFMVIEPTKGEYKDVFGGRSDVAVWGTNPYKAPLLRLNPFAFPSEIHVLEHIDRLVEVFNACWPMYAAMPAILKDAVETAYCNVGWDLRRSYSATCVFPTFAHLLNVLPSVIERASYSHDTSSDYKGALMTRVKSLTTGIFGQIFCSKDIPNELLFEKNAIVDLSRVGSSETKALLMGMLVLKLQEHRMANATGSNAKLRHVTVLEEAHHLLRRTSIEQSQESSNLQGKSVEMLANAIAEMRTYGEGFIIADQSPGLLDMSVIRNTNTKITLRLPDETDRQLVGKAAGLSDEQIPELARLEQGVAAISQSNWQETVLCKVDYFQNKVVFRYEPKVEEWSYIEKFFKKVIGMSEQSELTQEDVDALKEWKEQRNIDAYTKGLIRDVMHGETLDEEQHRELLYNLLDVKRLANLTTSPTENIIPELHKRIALEFDIEPNSEVTEQLCIIVLELIYSLIREGEVRHNIERILLERGRVQ